MPMLTPHATGYAVVDFETTGLRPQEGDRAIEVGIVLLSPDGVITGEAETLIRVRRDIGLQSLHHIGAAELMDAPEFPGIAAQLRDYLDGRVFVAHNASFDMAVLAAEMRRLGFRSPVTADNSLCTSRMGTKLLGVGSLKDCCAKTGIINTDAHSALGDARATARLLRHYMRMVPSWPGWRYFLDQATGTSWPSITTHRCAWIPRSSHADKADPPHLRKSMLDRIPSSDTSGSVMVDSSQYTSLLGRSLVDGRLSEHEKAMLVDAARTMRMDRETVRSVHGDYFDELAKATWDDDMVSYAELDHLRDIGKALEIDDAHVEATVSRISRRSPHGKRGRHASTVTTAANGSGINPLRFRLHSGDHIVLTGQMRRQRNDWRNLLSSLDIVAWPSVTRKVRLLVAADTDSESAKARKARDYGIPIVNEAWLERAVADGIDVD